MVGIQLGSSPPQEAPFVMIRSNTSTGNHRYEGFCVDLLKQISFMVGFQYEIEISDGGVYGVYDTENEEWNGLVRGLKDKVSGKMSMYSY